MSRQSHTSCAAYVLKTYATHPPSDKADHQTGGGATGAAPGGSAPGAPGLAAA